MHFCTSVDVVDAGTASSFIGTVSSGMNGRGIENNNRFSADWDHRQQMRSSMRYVVVLLISKKSRDPL